MERGGEWKWAVFGACLTFTYQCLSHGWFFVFVAHSMALSFVINSPVCSKRLLNLNNAEMAAEHWCGFGGTKERKTSIEFRCRFRSYRSIPTFWFSDIGVLSAGNTHVSVYKPVGKTAVAHPFYFHMISISP